MASSDSLALVTLNTWKNGGDYACRVALMSEHLAALAPDLLFLQEVFIAPSAGLNTGEALAAALKMDSLHAPARCMARPHGDNALDSSSGLALMSRVPIASHQRLSLSPDPDGSERVALIAQMPWNDMHIAIVNLHLTFQPDAHALRRAQLQEIVQAVCAGASADAIILAGDFNAEPDSPPLRWLREASGFSVSDAWDAAGGPRPTMTDPPGSTTIGSRCVDHIILLQPPESAALTFVAAERVLDSLDSDSGILPSDHAGLRAVLARAI